MGTWRKPRESRARPLSPSYVGEQQLYIGIYIAAGEWDGLHRRVRVVVVVEPSIRSESEQGRMERKEGEREREMKGKKGKEKKGKRYSDERR